jgi:DNA polymerase
VKTIDIEGDFDAWREAARELLANGVPPEMVVWKTDDRRQESLLETLRDDEVPDRSRQQLAVEHPRVPRRFVDVAERVAHHRDPARWPLMYRVLWRITHGEARLMEISIDEDISQLHQMDKSVRRDAHKMKAFVRFRRVDGPEREHFIAWHEPDHLVVPYVAPFFQDRFASMDWTILTPDASVSWDGESLEFGPGVPRSAAPDGDELESLWKTYYRAIFNPARIKLKAMQAEMPQKHWATMPETEVMQDILREAPDRVRKMLEHQPENASSFVPDTTDLRELKRAIRGCTACDLCARANGAVFGEGPSEAAIMLVGEQPGDCEDRDGRPFVGPAGELLNRGLEAAGLAREACYVTNAVKAFKHDERDGKRLHKRPDAYETEICKPWLAAEIRAVRPNIIVALGATAAHSVTGRRVAITRERGEHRSPFSEHCIVTFHPSAVLRVPDQSGKQRRFDQLVEDLASAVQLS